MRNKARHLAYAAILAALYAVLTHMQNLLFPGSATWMIQLRLSEALMVLWALTRELRSLHNMAHELARGIPLDRILASQRPPIWEKRRPLFARAVQRHPADSWARLLRLAQLADEQIKGQAAGSVWDSLALILIQACGTRMSLD